MAAGDLRIPGEGVLIGDKLYSGVTLTLDNCRVPAERLQSSPSADHGLTSIAEEQLRMRGCELIQAAGILLKLPQVGEKYVNRGPTCVFMFKPCVNELIVGFTFKCNWSFSQVTYPHKLSMSNTG